MEELDMAVATMPPAAAGPAAGPADGTARGGWHAPRLRLAVGIATVGRPEVVARMLGKLARQTRPADMVVVCSPHVEEIVGLEEVSPGIRLVIGPRGLPAQRNAILDALHGFDVVLFLDDDFVPAPDYLAETEAAFLRHPDVVMTTGRVLADGILGPGLSFEEAERIIGEAAAPAAGAALTEVPNGYGCNMAVRLAAAYRHGLSFDENLPSYAWLEDVDFGIRLSRHGRIVRAGAARGVHLGVKSGRQPGLRTGYSQVANPLYLARKGSCPWRRALYLMARNIAANLLRRRRPEPHVDRAGRLAGNLQALRDLARGRLHPTRILAM